MRKAIASVKPSITLLGRYRVYRSSLSANITNVNTAVQIANQGRISSSYLTASDRGEGQSCTKLSGAQMSSVG